MLQGFAFDYTDENGVTWSCQTNYEYNDEGSRQDYATLTGASNYGSEVIVPEKVYDGETAYTVNYLESTFKNSNIITKVTLPKTPLTIYAAFSQCNNLSEVVNSQYIVKCTMGAFEYTNLTSIDLSNCKFVGGFDSSKNLKTVILKACETIEERAFFNCTSLQTLGETTNITEVRYGAFNGCTSLTSIDLSNCTTFAAQYYQEAIFGGCTNLNKVILSKSLTDIPSYLFSGCSGLTSFDFSNITSIGESAFEGTGLTSVVLPTTVKEIAASTFKSCRNLKSVDLGNVTSIGESAFEDTGLTSVVLPTTVKEIAANTFKSCSYLKSVDLGNVTSIGESAFEFCYNLDNIKIPETTNSIGDLAFEGTKLENITLPSSIMSIGREAFYNVNYITINATKVPSLGGTFGQNSIVLVPNEALNNYRTANTWKDFAGQIFAIGTKLDYDVKTTAQDNAPGLLQQLDRNNLNSVVTLKVSGTINSYDIMLFRNKMDNLHHLDLSEADIVANPYEYYQGYSTQDSILGDYSFAYLNKLITVKLPKNVIHIGIAFKDCYNLQEVELPSKLYSIGTFKGSFSFANNGSFQNCTNLRNINFSKCDSIGDQTFAGCSHLESLELPKGLKIIGGNAFEGSSIKKINLPEGLKLIDNNAFFNCNNLYKIVFPPSLEIIGESSFYGCTSLDSISLPGLSKIGNRAFENCRYLKELRVPSTLESIGAEAFSGCNLEKVYAYTVLPISISQNTFDNFSNISLYVPTQSVDNYYLNTQWSQFKEIHEFNEPYKYFYLDKEFTLDEKRFDGTPDIDIKQDGGLTVDGKDKQEAGDITIKGDGDNGNSGTLITDGNVNAKKMKFEIQVTANKWYFFSFPFDIKFADTKAPGEYKWKRYDGSIRADQGFGGWVDIAKDEEYLKQGVGYIFQTNQEGILTLSVTKDKFGQLDANNVMKELDSYPSGNNFDASWNFIGNPQTSYFNVNDLGYQAPITVWNGNSYEAVRPGDDDYTLHPFEAFFVQKPTAVSGIEFKAEDRLTKTGSVIRAQETKARRIARGITPSRLIINLSVSDGTQTDKTRVVFNNQKSRDYEMDCDAAKFMTMTAAPQLYSIEGKGTQFAINERPMGSVQLGFSAKKAGTYTISAARMDQPMLLKDNQAGVTFDLTNGDYEFTSGAGTFNTRFMLIANGNATGIADIVSKTGVNIMPTDEGLSINGANGKTIDVYNLNGMQVASRNSDGMLNLPTGVYIVKVEGLSSKVMVK